MQKLRAILFNLLFYVVTTLLGILFLPWMLLPQRVTGYFSRFWVRTVFAILRLVVGLRFQVRGHDRIPAGPAIYAVKHQSAWDTLAITLLVPDGAIVLKRELTRIPVFGWALLRAGHIPVDRTGAASALKGMIRRARHSVVAGRSIVIFPEGTRMAPGTHRPYHPGVAALYTALDLPVVPVALNSGLFWPRRSMALRPGVVTLEFLPPIAPGLSRKAFMQALEAAIEPAAARLNFPATP